MNKAVFLDKDGTLIRDVPHNVDPALIGFENGAFESLQQLQGAGYRLLVVSNQSGVALGYFREQDLKVVEVHIKDALGRHKIRLDGFYYCPHAEADDCGCRKPRPGLLRTAALEHRIELSRSWMIGDILHDVEAGNRAGCKTILIDNGNETEWIKGPYRDPDFKAANLLEAAAIILGQKDQLRGNE